jgi:hypothetical protein
MDAVFSIFVHSMRSSNPDVWPTGTCLGGFCCRLDRYDSRLYSGIRKLDVFEQPIGLHLLAVPPSRRHPRPVLLPLMSADQLRYYSD